MRRVLLAAALVLGTAAAAAPPDSTHTDNALHFSVLIPAGWKEGRLGEPNPPAFAMVPPGYEATGARCVLALKPGPYLSGLTQDQYKNFVRAGWFKKSLARESLTLVSSELADRGAYLLEIDEVRGVLEGQAFMFYRASTVSDGMLYQFGCMIHEADYARAKPEMARIVRSFAVTP